MGGFVDTGDRVGVGGGCDLVLGLSLGAVEGKEVCSVWVEAPGVGLSLDGEIFMTLLLLVVVSEFLSLDDPPPPNAKPNPNPAARANTVINPNTSEKQHIRFVEVSNKPL